MSFFDSKVIHTGRLFSVERVSPQMGKRVFRELEDCGEIEPEVTPSGRKFVSPIEAAVFHEALLR